MKTILVTGGAGFIGSHLCERLLLDNEVVCLDNFFTGQKRNIIAFIRFFLILSLFVMILTYLFIMMLDQIYNLACPASQKYYQSDVVQTIKTNINGSINVLDLAKRVKARVLQASTSEVYGKNITTTSSK